MVNFPSADTVTGKGQNEAYTHSFGWDNSAANHDMNMVRCSTESPARVPELGETAMGPSLRLGALFFTSSG